MRGDGGVAGEGGVVGVPKFHSWCKCTMPFTKSTQIGCPTLPLACVLYYIIYLYYAGPLICILGCNSSESASVNLRVA